MEKANKTQKRNLYSSIGWILSFALVLTAFKWKVPKEPEILYSVDVESSEGILFIPPTKIPMPKPPKVKKLFVPEQIVETKEEPEQQVEVSEPIVELPGIENVNLAYETIDNEFVPVPEVQAMPEGGFTAFYKKLSEELVYPRKARQLNVEGKVYVQFIVNADGELSDFEVVRGIGAGCDEEALRSMKKMGKWEPARNNGYRVKTRMVIPIYFNLN